MQDKFLDYRKKYKEFVYESFEIQELEKTYKIVFTFSIPGLVTFNPIIEIDKKYFNKHDSFSEYLIFHIGLVELISYWKCCCPEKYQTKMSPELLKMMKNDAFHLLSPPARSLTLSSFSFCYCQSEDH